MELVPHTHAVRCDSQLLHLCGRYTAWAGKDATVALGLMSLDPSDAGCLDYGRLGPAQWKTVIQWRDYFDQKYRVVGVLPDTLTAANNGLGDEPSPKTPSP